MNNELEDSFVIELCTGEAQSRAFYAVLKIPFEKFMDYKTAAAQGLVTNLHAHGEVIASGWGEAVPQSVLDQLREEHGIQSIEDLLTEKSHEMLSVIQDNATLYNGSRA